MPKRRARKRTSQRRASSKSLFEKHPNLKILLIIFGVAVVLLLAFAKITEDSVENIQQTPIMYTKPMVKVSPSQNPSPTPTPTRSMMRY